MLNLKKVIIPIAGLGTRMLPATKAIPKEMLPVVTKPIIQYVVEEAVLAGFKEIVFVTHSSKSSVENHFDTSFELEATLEKRVKRALLKEIKAISKLNILINSVRQGEAKGLGHAILSAKSVIGKDPFAIILPDMLLRNYDKNCNLSIMKKNFEKNGYSSILLGKASRKNIKKYGIAKIKKTLDEDFIGHLEDIIEKPSLSRAPSSLFAAGRYIFNNSFFNFLKDIKQDSAGEIQLTDAISKYIYSGEKVCGFRTTGDIYDCGDKLGYLKAVIDFSLDDKSIKRDLLIYLKKIIN